MNFVPGEKPCVPFFAVLSMNILSRSDLMDAIAASALTFLRDAIVVFNI